ncbi:hypothetical protein L7F22_044522 [Adiantum nelumboides]|nr:hypothetical protein [Adiantum nelumboides]
MISRMIRSKSSVPHDIIRAELAAPPMLVEALFQTVCLLHRFRDMDPDRISHRAFIASRDMALAGDTSSWYAQTGDCLAQHGLDIDRLPPLQYDTQAPTYSLSRSERNRVIRQEIWHTYIQRTWRRPTDTLPPKMLWIQDTWTPSERDLADTCYSSAVSRAESYTSTRGPSIPEILEQAATDVPRSLPHTCCLFLDIPPIISWLYHIVAPS